MKTNHDGTVTLNAYDTWTSCVACGQRVTGDSIHTCSPQLKELTEEEIDLVRNVIDGYVCTIKMEIDQEKQVFKGYEHCSNLPALESELIDAKRAYAILRNV